MTQHGRPVLDAMVWSVGEVAGLEHEDVTPPDVRRVPPTRPNRTERGLGADDGGEHGRDRPRFAFWGNFDQRMIEWSGDLAARRTAAADVADLGPLPADGDASTTPGSTPRGRSSSSTWGAGRPGRGRTCHLEPPFIAPSLDLYASFQYPGSTSEWMLLDAHSPVAQAACSRGPAGSGPRSAG